LLWDAPFSRNIYVTDDRLTDATVTQVQTVKKSANKKSVARTADRTATAS